MVKNKDIKKSNQNNTDFLRTSNQKEQISQIKPKPNIKKFIRNTILVTASALMLYASPLLSNANYSKNLISKQAITQNIKNSTKKTSINWAGYIAASSFTHPKPNVKSIIGEWKVPNIQYKKPKNLNYLLIMPSGNISLLSFRPPIADNIWIGIGGQFKKDKTLIQTGTSSYYSQKLHHEITIAWYELLPDNQKTIINFKVKFGDEIYAKIKLLNKNQNKWEIKLYNLTENESFKKIVNYNSSMLSAEWIVERPQFQEILTIVIPGINKDVTIPITTISKLNNFKTFQFKSDIARINSITEPLALLNHEQIKMRNKNKIIVAPSKINEYGLGFKLKRY